MALYTPPPSSGPLNSVLPAILPYELVYPCNFPSASRLPQKPSEPITPPVSTRRTYLPSIKHFDMTLPRPDSEDEETYSMSEDEDEDTETLRSQTKQPSPDFCLSDWFPNSQYHSQQSSLHIAEKTCEMVCYLWFATNSSSSTPGGRHPPYFVPHSNSLTASLQFCVSPNFVQFMQKVLETTQVSQSVIVLSLHYIYRLKERNRLTNGESGSEFRVAIAALMMANKFVDDNTYTNKTWSDVSGIPLTEINKMEREILLGIDFSLYVDKTTYDSWLNLLKGLVLAKEKGSMQWRRSSSGGSRSGRLPRTYVPSKDRSSPNRATSAYSTPPRAHRHRARSTSPPMQSFRYPFTFTAPTSSYTPTQSSQTPLAKPGAKRSADDAFSPTSASFYPLAKPAKRQMGVPALSLSIPNTQPSAHDVSPNVQRKSNSPLDGLGLNHFSKLTLANSPAVSVVREMEEPMWVSSQRQHVPPKTLSASWALPDRERTWVAPQNLYYYSLTCSPAVEDNQPVSRPHGQEPVAGAKKAKLRYHPAPQSLVNASSSATSTGTYRSNAGLDSRGSGHTPMVVHSASTSPSVREDWLEYRQQHASRLQVTVPMLYSQSPARLSVTSSDSTPSSVSVSTPSSALPSQEMRMEVPVLPPFNELVSSADGINGVTHHPAYPFGVQTYDSPHVMDDQSHVRYSSVHSSIVDSGEMESGVIDEDAQTVGEMDGLQAAPFANAGPPGVHHYGYGCNNQNGSWEFQPYLSAYAPGYGHMNMTQYAATTGWVRTR